MTSNISTLRDQAFNLMMDIQAANEAFRQIKGKLATQGISIERHGDEGDIAFLQRVTIRLTEIEQEKIREEAIKAITLDSCTTDSLPTPTVNLRRPTTMVGRWLNKASQLVG